MKKSNILVTAAIIVTLSALVTYDFFIRQVYASGAYKIPYYNYTSLPYTGFDKIDMTSSTAANVKIVQGPFSVRVSPDALEYVTIKEDEGRLSIGVIFPGNYRGNSEEFTFVISCPYLEQVTAGATYDINKTRFTDTLAKDDWRMRKVVVDGFTQDSLSFFQDYGSSVVLTKNNIRSLRAEVGTSRGSGSDLLLSAGNHIDSCTIDVKNRSRFFLENAVIQKLQYTIGDSAKIIVSGNAQHLIK